MNFSRFKEKRLFPPSMLILFLLVFGSCESLSWGGEDYGGLRKYLNFMGDNFYCFPEIAFEEIGFLTKENSDRLWPFDIEKAPEKYMKITKEVMGTAFNPVVDYSSVPLIPYVSVSIINDKDALAALIKTKIVKRYVGVDQGKSGEVQFTFPIVFWDKSYLYIDPDYLSNEKDAKYHFSEIIDKYIKEFLHGFVRQVLYYRKLTNK